MTTQLQKYILAIDLGTSGPKVALVSTYGDVLAHEFEKTELILLPGGGAEQSPDDWWQAIKKATRRLLEKKLVPLEEVTALSVTSQWSGTVAVDKNGKHLMNAVIWMDSRGERYVRDKTGGLVTIEGYGIGKLQRYIRLTGGLPSRSGKDPVAHILYIQNEFPEIYQQTHKFLEPKDYLNLQLTGKFAASFDSIALHWVTDNRDISNINYDDNLIKMSGINRDHLPELKRAVDILGTIKKDVAEELGLNEGVQVIVGTPDIHSAAIGSGAVADYQGHLYLGTSSWLVSHVPFKKTDILHNMASLPSAVPNRYLIMTEQEVAGEALNHLKNNLIFPDDELTPSEIPEDVHQALNRVAETIPPGSDKLIFTPWLYGERTPVEDHTVRGGFFNMTLKTTRAHMIRAVFEGVAYNSRWLLMYVEKFMKKEMEAVNVIGGGANSDLWCQIHADVLNRPMRQVKNPIQANLRGAGFLAAVAMGYMDFEDIPDRIQIEKTFQPNPANRAIYDELFGEFLNIYKNNKKIYARLNQAE